jgi:hypothetical protein
MTSLAQNRDQHLQRFHNQLISWQEDVNRLRAKAFSANSYLQGEMNKLVTQMDKRIQQLTERLVQVAEKGDRRVYDALENMESTWSTLRGNITDMMGRMREKRGEGGGGGQLQDTLERGKQAVRQGVDQVEETVKRGASKARQALGEQGQQGTQAGMQGGGTQSAGSTTGRRGASTGAGSTGVGETDTTGSTSTAGTSIPVTRTRPSH